MNSPIGRRVASDNDVVDDLIMASPRRVESMLSAVLLHRQGQADAAVRAMQSIEQLAPHDPCVLYWLGRMLVSQQRFDEAADALGMCVELMSLYTMDAFVGRGGNGGVQLHTPPPQRWRTPQEDTSPGRFLPHHLVEQCGSPSTPTLGDLGVLDGNRPFAGLDSHPLLPPPSASPLLHFTKGDAQQLLKGVRKVQARRSQREEYSRNASMGRGSPRGEEYPPARRPGLGDGISLLIPRTLPRSVWERMLAVTITVWCVTSSAVTALGSCVAAIGTTLRGADERRRMVLVLLGVCIAAGIIGVFIGFQVGSAWSPLCPPCVSCTAQQERTLAPLSYFLPLLL